MIRTICSIVLLFIFMRLSGQILYKHAYVVDTININNPHKAFIQKGANSVKVYCEGDKLNIVNKGNLRKLINSSNIYFTAINFYSFITPKNLYSKGPSNCEEILSPISKGGKVDIFKVEGVDKYLLCLININYFNKKQESVDYKSWKIPFDKGTYVKVVFPLCN